MAQGGENAMNTRRTFLVGMAVASGVAAAWSSVMKGQNPFPQAPQPQDRRPQEAVPESPPMPNAEKKILEQNDKDMKKKVDRLYELATELKNQVDKTDSSKVLSLDLVKKAEEIEKLARDIKNRSKG
jgi:TolA-binding protein